MVSAGPLPAPQTPPEALRAVRHALAEAGCPDAEFDAQQLVCAVLGPGRDPRFCETPLTPAQQNRLAELTRARAARKPLQYLLGEWDFLDFTLAVGEGVLCPRADSEVVCETAVALLRQRESICPAPRVLDLFAGSGCLGLGVRRFVPQARVRCVENSPAALRYLRQNAERALAEHGIAPPAVEVVEADVLDWWQTLAPQSVDLIVANPPYLTAAEMTARNPETAQEPEQALYGGEDGLSFYRCLAQQYQNCLCPGGFLVAEIGCDQREAVLQLGEKTGWTECDSRQDYGGRDRVVVWRRPG